jgi:hypothetical protein
VVKPDFGGDGQRFLRAARGEKVTSAACRLGRPAAAGTGQS